MSNNSPSTMQAYRLYGHVTHDHKLEIDLPISIQEGPTEVIVFSPGQPEIDQGDTLDSLMEFLTSLSKSPRKTKSKEEIDNSLDLERSAWG